MIDFEINSENGFIYLHTFMSKHIIITLLTLVWNILFLFSVVTCITNILNIFIF